MLFGKILMHFGFVFSKIGQRKACVRRAQHSRRHKKHYSYPRKFFGLYSVKVVHE